jgi:hypothetical protein
VAALFVLGVFVFVIWVMIAAAKKGSAGVQQFDRLQQSGLPGRGLVLTSSVIAVGTTINGRRFEQRTMTLDIEIWGRPPYVIQGNFMVPRGLVEAMPGSSLDVSVDPNDASKIAILGPGGFSGPWLNVGPPQPY